MSADIPSLPEDIGLPRDNGELLFEAPWEARAFGVAVALHEKGKFEWKAFSQALAAQIRRSELAGQSNPYYESWLAALRVVVTHDKMLTPGDIDIRSELLRHQDDHGHIHSH